MILFKDIFNRAVNLFDDPDIRKKFYDDPVGFEKVMRPFLIVGKDKFTSPTAVTDKLCVYSDAQGKDEIIDGENTETYILSTTPVSNSVFTYRIGTEIVPGLYDSQTNSVTFPREVRTGETCSVCWYYAGAFTEDFSNCLNGDLPNNSIMEKIINILAYGILSAWSDLELNRSLEIRNLLSDADMSFYSPANSAKAKIEWYNNINKDMDSLISELNWRILATPTGGSRFGK